MILTSPDPEFDRMVQRTVAGMADWAGTGPKGMACGDCGFLVPRGAIGYGCDKYRQLTGEQPRQDIPRRTPSCKYFEARK
jgi:hypothetical protein